MINSKKHITFIFALIFAPLALFAQGGSNYSIYGIGDIDINPTAAFDGLAGTSVAFPTEHSISPVNPALWSKINQTRLLTGYRFNQNFVEDNKNNNIFQNNGRLTGLSTIFVIDTGMGISAAFGINPYSSVNYYFTSPLTFEKNNIKLTGETTYQGSGGISMAYLGGSVNIFDNLSFGALAFASFGVIHTESLTSLNDEFAYQSETENNFSFNGTGFRLGLLYEPINNFFFGAFTELNTTSDLENQTILIYPRDSVTLSESLNINIPNTFGFGMSYLTGKFRLGMDYKIYAFDKLNFNQTNLAQYKNMQVISVAMSRLGNKSPGANFADKITYNLGLGYKQLYYSVAGTDINETFGSVGMNIPVIGSAIIDASFTFGSRGVLSDKLIHEYFGRFSIDLSIGETWFKPFKREY